MTLLSFSWSLWRSKVEFDQAFEKKIGSLFEASESLTFENLNLGNSRRGLVVFLKI